MTAKISIIFKKKVLRFNLYVLYLHTTNIFFVMKQPTTENSDIIKLVAILGDFALLNLSMILVFFILKGIDSQAIAIFH